MNNLSLKTQFYIKNIMFQSFNNHFTESIEESTGI